MTAMTLYKLVTFLLLSTTWAALHEPNPLHPDGGRHQRYRRELETKKNANQLEQQQQEQHKPEERHRSLPVASSTGGLRGLKANPHDVEMPDGSSMYIKGEVGSGSKSGYYGSGSGSYGKGGSYVSKGGSGSYGSKGKGGSKGSKASKGKGGSEGSKGSKGKGGSKGSGSYSKGKGGSKSSKGSKGKGGSKSSKGKGGSKSSKGKGGSKGSGSYSTGKGGSKGSSSYSEGKGDYSAGSGSGDYSDVSYDESHNIKGSESMPAPTTIKGHVMPYPYPSGSKGSYGKGASTSGSKGSKGKGGSKGSKGKGGSKASKGKGGSKGSKGKGGSKASKGKGGSKGSKGKGGSKSGSYGSTGKGGSGDYYYGHTDDDMEYGSGDVAGVMQVDQTVPDTFGCTLIEVVFQKDEIAASEFTTSTGFGLSEVPFYDPTSGVALGTYSDFATDIPDSDECVVNGAFSFERDAAIDNAYRSQIFISFTCNSQYNTIIGGSGKYGCAKGYEVFPDENEETLTSSLYLCNELCPYRYKFGDPLATVPPQP